MAGSIPKTPYFCIDCSHWTIINWRALAVLPALVIPKVSEGSININGGFADPKFFNHVEGARSIGARLGGYHFLRPGDMGNQAELFIRLTRQAKYTPREVLVLDDEDFRTTLQQGKQWLDHVERETGNRPIIYARGEQINSKVSRDYRGRPPAWFADYYWWIAGYPLPNADRFASMPAAYLPRGVPPENLAAWQYEEKGVMSGLLGNQNDFNQVTPRWANHIQLTEATENDMPIDEYKFRITPTNSIGSKIRGEHNISAPQVGSLPFGQFAFGFERWIAPADIGTVTKAGDTWLLVQEANGAPVIGWIAEIHLGVRYATIRELITDPEPEPAPKTISRAVIYFTDGTPPQELT